MSHNFKKFEKHTPTSLFRVCAPPLPYLSEWIVALVQAFSETSVKVMGDFPLYVLKSKRLVMIQVHELYQVFPICGKGVVFYNMAQYIIVILL